MLLFESKVPHGCNRSLLEQKGKIYECDMQVNQCSRQHMRIGRRHPGMESLIQATLHIVFGPGVVVNIDLSTQVAKFRP